MKKISALLTAMLILFNTVAYADVTIEQFDGPFNTPEIQIKGTATAGSKVVLTVLNKGETVSSVDGISTQSGKIEKIMHLSQFYADKNTGEYVFSFTMTPERNSGTYVFKVADGSDATEGEFTYYNADEVETIIESLEDIRVRTISTNAEQALIDKQEKCDDFKEVILDPVNISLLGLQGDFYQDKKIEDMSDSVFYSIANSSVELKSGEQLKNMIKEYHSIALIKDAATNEAIENLLVECEDVIKWTVEDIYTLYSTKEESKNFALSAVLNDEKFTTVNELKGILRDGVLLYEINASDNWSNIKTTYNKYPSYFDLNGTPTDVDFSKTSKGIPFDSKKSFEDKLQSEIDTPDSTQSSGTGSGGSGGSGNAGGFGGSYNSNKVAVTGGSNVAEFKPFETPKHNFKDLIGYEWAQKAIDELYMDGILNGKSVNEFKPEDMVTREEFTKLLICLLNIKPGENKSHFIDVLDNMWYTGYIERAYENGIVNGISETSFGVGMPITRQDMAVMVYNAVKDFIKDENTKNEKKIFSDFDEVSEYAKNAVSEIQRIGVINGLPDGSFAPEKNCERAEAAQIIYNMKCYIQTK